MPVRDILLDDAGERQLVNGDYAFADKVQAVKQGIACRVKLFLTEYWLDNSKGVDWIDKIFVRGASEVVIKSELAAAIADTPDVTQVVTVSFNRSTADRTGSVAYNAYTIYGEISDEVTLG